MTVGAVVILTEEYKELIEKSLKYDALYEMALESSFLTDKEKLIYGIDKTEAEKEWEQRMENNEAV
jgi:hypothetical protein